MSPAKPGVASTDILAILAVTCQAKEIDIGDLSSKKWTWWNQPDYKIRDQHTEFTCERTL